MPPKPLTATIAERAMLSLVSDSSQRRAAPPSAVLSGAVKAKLDRGEPLLPRRNHALPAPTGPDRSHVEKPPAKPEPEAEPVAAKKKRAKLTDEMRAKMVERLEKGEKVPALAKEYGLTESGVYYARSRAKAKAKAKASNGAPDRTPRGMKGKSFAELAKRYAELEAEMDKVKRAMRKTLGAS